MLCSASNVTQTTRQPASSAMQRKFALQDVVFCLFVELLLSSSSVGPEIKISRVIVARHRILTMDICIQTKKRVKPRRRKQQIKWWRLKDRDENRKFASRVEEQINDVKEWNQLEALLLDTAKSVLGQTT